MLFQIPNSVNNHKGSDLLVTVHRYPQHVILEKKAPTAVTQGPAAHHHSTGKPPLWEDNEHFWLQQQQYHKTP